jgi:hypothetical protein
MSEKEKKKLLSLIEETFLKVNFLTHAEISRLIANSEEHKILLIRERVSCEFMKLLKKLFEDYDEIDTKRKANDDQGLYD